MKLQPFRLSRQNLDETGPRQGRGLSKLKRFAAFSAPLMLLSSLNSPFAFADLGDTWQANASGLRESTQNWVYSKVSSDGQTQVAVVGAYPNMDDIYVSSDFGNTWAKRNPTTESAETVMDVEISEDGSSIVVMTNRYSAELGQHSLFHVSTDFGLTWSSKGHIGAGIGTTDFALSANGQTIVTIGTIGELSNRGKVFYSLNAGSNWIESPSTPTDLCSVDPSWRLCAVRPETGHLHEQWLSIDVSPDGQRIVVGGGQTGIKVSPDFGQTWSTVAAGDLNTTWPKVAFKDDGFSIVARTASPEMGLIKIFKLEKQDYVDTSCSLDLNVPCAENGFGKPTAWLDFSASEDLTKVFGIGRATGDYWEDKQVFRSGNSGLAFSATTLPPANWTSISSDSSGNHLLATARGKQLYVSNDAGVTWTARSTGLVPATYEWIDVEASGTGQYLYANRDSNKIFRSDDYGSTWSDAIAPGFYSDGNRGIAVSEDGAVVVTTGTSISYRDDNALLGCVMTSPRDEQLCNPKVLISQNYGSTWQQHSLAGLLIVSLAISTDGSTQTAITLDYEIREEGPVLIFRFFVSRNSGDTWIEEVEFEESPTDSNGMGVAISNDGKNIVATRDGSSTFYTSTNYGVDWTQKSLPVGDGFVFQSFGNSFISGDGSKIYAKMQNGIYASSDLGTTWQEKNPSEGECDDVKLNDDGSQIAMGCEDAVLLSKDSGQTWPKIYNGNERGLSDRVKAITMSKDLSLVAFSTSRDVYVSYSGDESPSPSPSPTTSNSPSPSPTPKPSKSSTHIPAPIKSSKVHLTTVQFAYSSLALSQDSKAGIRKLVKKAGKKTDYVITGSAGAVAGVPSFYVKTLAIKRAGVVKAYLVRLGVKKSNIKIKVKITQMRETPKTKIKAG